MSHLSKHSQTLAAAASASDAVDAAANAAGIMLSVMAS